MKFTKVQSAGNDFVLIETSDLSKDWAGLATKICRRHYDVGADGLLLLSPSSRADMKMTILNSDGSEAEACGNGLRCLVYYAVKKEMIDKSIVELTIETAAGIRNANINKHNNLLTGITTSMGKPRFTASDIPVNIKDQRLLNINMLSGYEITFGDISLSLSFVSMGNPHAIVFINTDIRDFPLESIGPLVEKHKIFPKHTNFEVARILGREKIEMRVWERGVGETLACGSGACAVAVAAKLLGLGGEDVKIKLPGGNLEVKWNGKGEVFLGGKAKIVFQGEWQE